MCTLHNNIPRARHPWASKDFDILMVSKVTELLRTADADRSGIIIIMQSSSITKRAMALHSWNLLLLLFVSLHSVQSRGEFVTSRLATTRLAFAGGGFGSSSSSTKKSKKKRKRGGFSDLEPPPPSKNQEKVNETPKLDRFGLPPPTEDDIFPPLPEGTELIAASEGPTSLKEIKSAMKQHMPLAYDCFDENGVERTPSPGNLPMKLKLLHKSPPVLTIDNFFTPNECDETRRVTEQDDVFEVSSATFSPLATSKRTSTSWFCHYNSMPTLVSKARNRLGIPLEQMEEPQIVRYLQGQEFSWHHDEVPAIQLENGGQRIATLLVYLNTVKNGGGTIFKHLKDANGEPLTVKPVQGSALLFFPAFANGQPDDRTLHKGQVAGDTKW